MEAETPAPLEPATSALRLAAPTAALPGFAYFGKTPFSVVDRIENQNQLQDNFTYTHGSHTLRAGIDLRLGSGGNAEEIIFTTESTESTEEFISVSTPCSPCAPW